MIRLSDDTLELLLDETTGALRRLTDKKHSLVLAQSERSEAFILETAQNVYCTEFAKFGAELREQNNVRLTWDISPGVALTADIRLENGTLRFRANVENTSEQELCSLEYPLLDGFGPLNSGHDCLAHAYATGYLVREPFECFAGEGEGMRHMPYPEGFSGATMQFFTYYSEGTAGLLFAADDGECRQKWFNFYRSGDGLRASQIFGYEDIGAKKPLTMDWDFTVTLTNGDGWYEAADLYREWALRQKWCARGPLSQLAEGEKAGWLLEHTGAATFGINACHDRTRWIERYSEDIGAPIFHILGPDWPKVDQNYRGSLPGGYDDWFPTRFCRENVDAIRKYGGYFAPFEFDFLLATNKADSEEINASLQKWPEIPKARDAYDFHMLCPLCEYTHTLHVERDRQVVRESGCDSMYYDISANNIIKTCMSTAHGHAVGAGSAMTEAYRRIYEDTRSTLSSDSGRYIPLGTEMINETLIDKLDYYQARANAQPCSSLETWPFRQLLKAGKSELIPMFQYVYGGYAPLRLDGWGKLTDESGDIVPHTIAKTYLWGGLFEINSEYSPMEALDGEENSSDEHYCELTPRGYAYRSALAAYLAKFAALRTGELNRYLAYGEMRRPPLLKCERTLRSYFQYNHSNGASEQNDRGTIELDSVLAARYRMDGGELLLLANTTALPQEITLEENTFGGAKSCHACRDYALGHTAAEEAASSEFLHFAMKPFQLTAIEWKSV